MRDWILRLYPRGWRDRYGGEVAAMLADQPLTPRLILDLIAGAVDARVTPQSIVTAADLDRRKGANMTTLHGWCSPASTLNLADHAKSAAWIVAGTAGLTWLSIGLMQTLGRSLPVMTLRYAAFPLALLWASRWTTLKPYSRAAQAAILGTTALVVVAVCAIAAAIGHRF